MEPWSTEYAQMASISSLLAGDHAERRVVVPGDALRGRVQREVDTVRQRLLAERGREGRIDDGDRSAQRAQLVEIDQLEARVRRCLGQRQHRLARPDGGGERTGLWPSTNVISMPKRWHGPCRNASVPAYSWRCATMWSPVEHRAKITVATAPIPDANASASSAPSSAAIASSNDRTVGLAYRL